MEYDYIKRSEVILVSYEDMIKCPSFFVLKTIRDELIDVYEPFIHTDVIVNMSNRELMELCLYRSERNPLKYLSKRVFDYNRAFKDIMNKYENSYYESPKLKLCDYIDYLAAQKFIKSILIHSEEFDEKILADLSNMFSHSDKIKLVCGSIDDVLSDYNITGFFINNHKYISNIKKNNRMQYSEILVPVYGYNMKMDENGTPVLRTDINEYSKGNDFKVGLFNPVENNIFLLP